MGLFEENMSSMVAGKLDGPAPRIVAGTSATPCHAGVMRCEGSGANQSVACSAALVANGALKGAVLFAPSLPGYLAREIVDDEIVEVEYMYGPNEVVDHVKEGTICMRVEQSVTPQDPVYVRIQADPEDATALIGALRKDGGADVEDFEGVLINIESAADSAYTVYVNGIPFTFNQGAAGTLATKATGLAAALDGQAASANYPNLAAVVESVSKVRVRYAAVTDSLPIVEVKTADAALLTIEEAGTIPGPQAVRLNGAKFVGVTQSGLVRTTLNLA